MTTLELWINRHHRRLAFGLFLERAGEWLAVFLLLFGAAVLTAKLFLPDFWPEVLWLLTLVVPILLLAGRFAMKASFSRTESVALLDRQLKAGGLVMALAESDDPAWHGKLPKTPELWRRKLPAIWPVRFFRLVGWPAVFVLGALLIPLRNPQSSMGFSPAVGQQATRQLDNMIGLLEASRVLSPEETTELKQVVELLSKETESAPLTSEKWETIDHLRKTLTEKLTTDETTLAQASAIVSKVLETDNGQLEELLSNNNVDFAKVSEVLKTLNDKGALPEMAASLGPEVEELLAEGQKQLAEDPKLRARVFGQLQSLLQDRALDLEKVRSQFERAFSQMPTQSAYGQEGGLSNGPLPLESPGDPNVAEADGTLKWGEESQEKQAKFKQVVLPPGFAEDPKNQTQAGTKRQTSSRTGRPSENVATELPTDFESTTSGEIRSRELRPRHRAVVKKYFQTESAREKPEPSKKPSAGE